MKGLLADLESSGEWRLLSPGEKRTWLRWFNLSLPFCDHGQIDWRRIRAWQVTDRDRALADLKQLGIDVSGARVVVIWEDANRPSVETSLARAMAELLQLVAGGGNTYLIGTSREFVIEQYRHDDWDCLRVGSAGDLISEAIDRRLGVGTREGYPWLDTSKGFPRLVYPGELPGLVRVEHPVASLGEIRCSSDDHKTGFVLYPGGRQSTSGFHTRFQRERAILPFKRDSWGIVPLPGHSVVLWSPLTRGSATELLETCFRGDEHITVVVFSREPLDESSAREMIAGLGLDTFPQDYMQYYPRLRVKQFLVDRGIGLLFRNQNSSFRDILLMYAPAPASGAAVGEELCHARTDLPCPHAGRNRTGD